MSKKRHRCPTRYQDIPGSPPPYFTALLLRAEGECLVPGYYPVTFYLEWTYQLQKIAYHIQKKKSETLYMTWYCIAHHNYSCWQMWIPNIHLTEFDKEVIECGGWLCDQHMHATNRLLSNQFPHLQGLQSIHLSQNGGFTPVTSDGKLYA